MGIDFGIFSGLFSNFMAIFWMIFFFGGSIFVHELGHFLAAKKRGLKVVRFSMGFGPKMFSWTKNGTEYCISWLPLGGYVAIPQVSDMEGIEGNYGTDSKNLDSASFYDKFIVGIMGACFNLIFAFILACVLWQIGKPIAEQDKTTIIGYVQKNINIFKDNQEFKVPGPAFEAGLIPGDKILKIDGFEVSNFGDINKQIVLGSLRAPNGKPKSIFTIERDGKIFDLDIFPQIVDFKNHSSRTIGILPKHTLQIQSCMKNSPAEKAGLLPGDILIELDKKPLFSLAQLHKKLDKHPEIYFDLKINRSGTILEKKIRSQKVPYTRPIVKISNAGNENIFFEIIPFLPPMNSQLPFIAKRTRTSTKENTNTQSLAKLDTQSNLVVFDKNSSGWTFEEFNTGDRLISLNQNKIKSLQDLISYFKKDSENLFVFQNKKDNLLAVSIPNIKLYLTESQTINLIGIQTEQKTVLVYPSPFEQFSENFSMTFRTLKSFSNKQSDIKLNQFMGPTGIMRILHKFSMQNFRLLIWFVIILNINLAIVNLLPIPVLDGGQIIFAGIESITRRKIPERIIGFIQVTFMAILIGMTLYISFFDIKRWHGDLQSEKEYLKQSQLQINATFE